MKVAVCYNDGRTPQVHAEGCKDIKRRRPDYDPSCGFYVLEADSQEAVAFDFWEDTIFDMGLSHREAMRSCILSMHFAPCTKSLTKFK